MPPPLDVVHMCSDNNLINLESKILETSPEQDSWVRFQLFSTKNADSINQINQITALIRFRA